jgi:hypothetical protein
MSSMSTHPPRPASHQVVRLGRGSHLTPSRGACVMELASMLAGERFTDHPRSVCPVIASFLRAYNDAIDDERRQDLYRCAADVVGTRASRATERARILRCENELADVDHRCAPKRLRRAVRRVRSISPVWWVTGLLADLAGSLATSDDGHRRALALVDDLVDIAVPASPPCRLMSVRPDRAAASTLSTARDA